MIEEKERKIEELKDNLAGCADTLKSNAKMIEDLETSLAEAQKVSFRNMVSNRTKVDFSVTLPEKPKATTQAFTTSVSPVREREDNQAVSELSRPQSQMDPFPQKARPDHSPSY